MTDEDKLEGLVGRTVDLADLDIDLGFIHLRTTDGLMFHIRIDIDEDYETIEVNGDLPN